MKTGILGGTFDPVHNGHVYIGQELLKHTDLEEIWYVVSPMNPFKQNDVIIRDDLRLQMVRLALKGKKGLRESDIEMRMPKPSYMCDTLRALSKRYSRREFSLIIGSDNWPRFGEWKNSMEILSKYPIYVFSRKGYSVVPADFPDGVQFVSLPPVDVSSTMVREKILKGEDISDYVPWRVKSFIEKNKLYK